VANETVRQTKRRPNGGKTRICEESYLKVCAAN
jgi:hypothetical protein